MSSTYSTNLAIELIGTGDQAGNWGSTTNTNLGTLIEQAISGYTSQAINGTDVTLSMTQGASCTARNMYIVLTGSGGANLIVPNNTKLYFISNTASTAITVKTSAGTGVSVPVSAKICLLCDGTNVVVAENYMASLTLGAALPVLSGGTGVTTSTGSGANVLSTSPTLVTPVLGTPTSGNFSTGTFTWPTFNQNTTGTAAGLSVTLAVASGGTGVTTSTGTGSTVLSASPTLTGTPVAPTAASGTNTTQIATTAFVTTGLQAAYPVGAIYMSTVSTIPSTLFGFGTWSAFGAGRVLISQDGTYPAGSTGGSATVTPSGSISGTVGGTSLTEAQMPQHYHQMIGPTFTTGYPQNDGGGFGTFFGGTPDDGGHSYGTWSTGGGASSGGTSTGTANGNSHDHSFSGSFTGSSMSNLQPYISVYMWTRTA